MCSYTSELKLSCSVLPRILVGCSFSGFIPPELGKLSRLAFLWAPELITVCPLPLKWIRGSYTWFCRSLNSNKLRGSIPGELGNLSSLIWFDITDNEISGSIPVSDGTNLGLDMLKKCQHLYVTTYLLLLIMTSNNLSEQFASGFQPFWKEQFIRPHSTWTLPIKYQCSPCVWYSLSHSLSL